MSMSPQSLSVLQEQVVQLAQVPAADEQQSGGVNLGCLARPQSLCTPVTLSAEAQVPVTWLRPLCPLSPA